MKPQPTEQLLFKPVSVTVETWLALKVIAKHDERSLRAVVGRLVRAELKRLRLVVTNGDSIDHATQTVPESSIAGAGSSSVTH